MKGFLINSVGKYVTAEGEHAILFFFGTPEQQVRFFPCILTLQGDI
jgi:hypothetical protein